VVIPKKHVVIDDTWFTLGMRGTGSKDIVLDEVFVPDRHAVRMDIASLGTVPGVDIPLYRLPIRVTLGTMLLGTIVGMAERGLGLFVEQARTRRDAYTGADKVSNVLLQQQVAASGEIARVGADAAGCDLLEAAMGATSRCDRAAGSGPLERLLRQRAVPAGGRPALAGAGAAPPGRNVLQSVFRDLNTASIRALGLRHQHRDTGQALARRPPRQKLCLTVTAGIRRLV
jgi:alkylation response protein AidB-like acyl-CoA dehydrogenase